MKVHYSSKTNEWETPQELFNRYNEIYHFTLDVCATEENTKCKKFFTKKENGLLQNWSKDICWMNPPYGREISKWIEKAYTESLKGAIVVCLIPSRTDTIYWHNWIFPHAKIEFLKGRLKFSNSKYPAPFPSAIVIYTP